MRDTELLATWHLKAIYEFEVQIFANNARLPEAFPVKFEYNPASNDEIKIYPLSSVRLPWWRQYKT